jgi:hypothetical protein
MKAKFLKTGYGLLAALFLATQLIAAPIALTAEQTDLSIAARPNGDVEDSFCG